MNQKSNFEISKPSMEHFIQCNKEKDQIKKDLFYLECHFGAYSAGDLVDDLCVKATTVVHISHHDREELNIKSPLITIILGKHSK